MTKDIWGLHLLGPLMIPPSILNEKKYIRITRWLNPSDRLKVATGEIYVARWLDREVRRISASPRHREAWVLEHKDNRGLFAIVADKPEGISDYPEIYAHDRED